MSDLQGIAQEMRDLDALAQRRLAKRLGRRNKRYVFNLVFDELAAVGAAAGTPAIPKTARVTVGKPFYCASMDVCVRVIGSSSINGGATSVFNVPLGTMLSGTGSVIENIYALGALNVFDFFWSIRDSFGDREWTKGKQPSAILESAVGPLQLPRRQFVPAGTEVSLEIEPLYVLAGTTLSGEALSVTIKSIQLEFSLVGYET